VKLCEYTLGTSSYLSEPIIRKQVSQDSANYSDAPTEGIRRVLEAVTGNKLPRGIPLSTDKIGWTCTLISPIISDFR
jgi:hypothetical protein